MIGIKSNENKINFQMIKEKKNEINLILDKLLDANILKKDGLIIMHRHKKTQDLIPKKLKILEEKSYGISKILFLSLS